MNLRLPFLILLTASTLMKAAPPDLRTVVEAFDRTQAEVQTFQAPFTLTIRRALLRTPTQMKGMVYLQGRDFVHFRFAPPEDLILHLTPKALTSYSPQAGQGQQIKIGLIRNTNRRFLGLGQRLSELADYFQAAVVEDPNSPTTWRIDLTPRALSVKRRFQLLQIWMDRAQHLPRQIVWVERSGDRWELELAPPTLNQALPASITGFKVPEGVPLRPEFDFFGSRKK